MERSYINRQIHGCFFCKFLEQLLLVVFHNKQLVIVVVELIIILLAPLWSSLRYVPQSWREGLIPYYLLLKYLPILLILRSRTQHQQTRIQLASLQTIPIISFLHQLEDFRWPSRLVTFIFFALARSIPYKEPLGFGNRLN